MILLYIMDVVYFALCHPYTTEVLLRNPKRQINNLWISLCANDHLSSM